MSAITNKSDLMAEFRALFGPIPQKGQTAAYYAWKLQEGTGREGYLHLEMSDGHAVGSASVTGKLISVCGKEVLAYEIGDTYTHPDYRRKGIFLTAVNSSVDYIGSTNARFIYGTPNDASLPGYIKKAGFSEVKNLRIASLIKSVSIISVQAAIKKRLKLSFLAKLGASLLFPFLKRRAKRINVMDASLHRSDFKDFPNVDQTWGDKSNYCFWTVRNNDYAKWRFVSNPDEYELWLLKDAGMVMGYAVTKRFDRAGMQVGAICDFVVRNDDSNLIENLIRLVDIAMIKLGADYLELWCSTSSVYYSKFIDAAYKRLSDFPVILKGDPEITEKLLCGGCWHFTLSDSDNI
jgi:hypothetical protein